MNSAQATAAAPALEEKSLDPASMEPASPGDAEQPDAAPDEAESRLDGITAADAEKLNAAFDAIRAGLPGRARELFQSVTSASRRANGLAFVRRIEIGEALIARICDPVATESAPEPESGEHRLNGILVAPARRATARAVILFGGNGDRHFPIIPKPLLGGQYHLILVRDPSRCFTLCDVPRLGPDYETNLARLGRMLRQLGTTHVFVIGFSSGGFSALKFGLDLRARGVLVFGSPTTLDINDDPGSDLKKYPQLTALYRKARHLGTSMAKAYRAQKRHPATTLVYGANHARDTFCASLMAGIPGVMLEPLSNYAGHSIYNEAMGRGMIPALLTRLLESTPVTG